MPHHIIISAYIIVVKRAVWDNIHLSDGGEKAWSEIMLKHKNTWHRNTNQSIIIHQEDNLDFNRTGIRQCAVQHRFQTSLDLLFLLSSLRLLMLPGLHNFPKIFDFGTIFYFGTYHYIQSWFVSFASTEHVWRVKIECVSFIDNGILAQLLASYLTQPCLKFYSKESTQCQSQLGILQQHWGITSQPKSRRSKC